VLQELLGWSPYQQQTSFALVMESPIEAMLLGSAGSAAFENPGLPTRAATDSTVATSHLRIVHARSLEVFRPTAVGAIQSYPPGEQP
jgi:hypothetical protein